MYSSREQRDTLWGGWWVKEVMERLVRLAKSPRVIGGKGILRRTNMTSPGTKEVMVELLELPKCHKEVGKKYSRIVVGCKVKV
jgi:hypothetical protein